MDTARGTWVDRAEAAIRQLRDVEGACIEADGETIREVHVVTRSTRAAKQIVRDVVTVVQTLLKRKFDHRVVSVAYLQTDTAARARVTNGMPASNSLPAPEPVVEEPRPNPKRQSSDVPERESEPPDSPGSVRERIRFGGVNLFVSGPRTQAQVELFWRGLPRLGSASGWSTRAGANELIAKAALGAVQEFLVDEVAIGLQDLEILKLGRRRAVVVSLSMLVGRQEKILIGSCVVEQDVQQAVVCATLGALNRVVGALRPKEPTEYVLRPTSA